MKKALILALVLMGAAASVHAAPRYRAAVGGIFGIDVMGSLPSSAMLSFRLPKFPPVFGLGLTTNDSNPAFALMADWWLYQTNLVGFINLYIGPGLYTAFNGDYFTFGGRIPIGLNAYPLDPLEIFLEIAPSLTIFGSSGIEIPNFGLQAGFGFRFWF